MQGSFMWELFSLQVNEPQSRAKWCLGVLAITAKVYKHPEFMQKRWQSTVLFCILECDL